MSIIDKVVAAVTPPESDQARIEAREHGDQRHVAGKPGDELIRIGLAGQHCVVAMRGDLVGCRELGRHLFEQVRPIDRVLAAVQADLVLLLRHRRRVYGEPRRIGTALRHADEHGHHESAQLAAQCRFLDQKTDDSTHAAAPLTRP